MKLGGGPSEAKGSNGSPARTLPRVSPGSHLVEKLDGDRAALVGEGLGSPLVAVGRERVGGDPARSSVAHTMNETIVPSSLCAPEPWVWPSLSPH